MKMQPRAGAETASLPHSADRPCHFCGMDLLYYESLAGQAGVVWHILLCKGAVRARPTARESVPNDQADS